MHLLRSAFFRRLFIPYFLLICAVAAGVGAFAGMRLWSAYLQSRKQSLHAELSLVWDIVRDDLAAGRHDEVNRRIKALGGEIGCRITIVAGDGAVLADNWADSAKMENHRSRPEIAVAAQSGEGDNVRASDTVHEKMLYMAQQRKSDDGRVFFTRLAVPLRELWSELWLLGGGLVAFALSSILAAGFICYRFAERQSRPILELTRLAQSLAAGHLDDRSDVRGKGEVPALGAALNTMAASIHQLLMQTNKDREELLAILSSMSEGVIATDAQQNIVVVNQAAGRIFGFEPAAAMGKPLWQIVRIDSIIKAAGEVLGSRQQQMIEAGLVGGRHLEVCLCAFPPRGAMQGLVVVTHDTTQSVRYQELRKEFVANVSHELRTPLTVIKGFVETLRDGALEDPKKAREYLTTVERHTNQLTNLVNDLLELSRLESQPDLPRAVSVDIAGIVRKAVDMLAPAAQKKKQTLTADIGRVPVIAGNPDYLERAVANLIDNAIKYTPDSGQIRVTARADNGGVVVEVADDGIGIPDADLPRIFERFYRVDRSRSRDMGGTGLGLSIVKHIVQAHGGTMEVNSIVGKGSTFRFSLPVPQAGRTQA